MMNEINEDYVKSMISLYSQKGYNEFSEEDLKALEKLMIEGLKDNEED